jgi:hypothetical protein
MAHVEERNQDATCYVGDLATQVDEAILWELFLQCGPVGMSAEDSLPFRSHLHVSLTMIPRLNAI